MADCNPAYTATGAIRPSTMRTRTGPGRGRRRRCTGHAASIRSRPHTFTHEWSCPRSAFDAKGFISSGERHVWPDTRACCRVVGEYRNHRVARISTSVCGQSIWPTGRGSRSGLMRPARSGPWLRCRTSNWETLAPIWLGLLELIRQLDGGILRCSSRFFICGRAAGLDLHPGPQPGGGGAACSGAERVAARFDSVPALPGVGGRGPECRAGLLPGRLRGVTRPVSAGRHVWAARAGEGRGASGIETLVGTAPRWPSSSQRGRFEAGPLCRVRSRGAPRRIGPCRLGRWLVFARRARPGGRRRLRGGNPHGGVLVAGQLSGRFVCGPVFRGATVLTVRGRTTASRRRVASGCSRRRGRGL